MNTARLVRASAAPAAFVKRPAAGACAIPLLIFLFAIATTSLRASSTGGLAPGPPPQPAAGAADARHDFQLRLALRAEPAAFLSLQGRPRRFQLREFVESSLPPAPSVSLGDDESREGWDWAGFRRQLVRALAGVRKLRIDRDGLSAESDRFDEPGRMPGVVQDASIAAGVRARLATEPSLRGLSLEVRCREGRVQIRGVCAHCPETARAVMVALAVEGVREVRADLPADLQREMAADR